MAGEWMDGYGAGSRRRARTVRVKLACGCTAMLVDWPRHDGVKLGCQSGQGHGYQLDWTEWTDTANGRTRKNRKFS